MNRKLSMLTPIFGLILGLFAVLAMPRAAQGGQGPRFTTRIPILIQGLEAIGPGGGCIVLNGTAFAIVHSRGIGPGGGCLELDVIFQWHGVTGVSETDNRLWRGLGTTHLRIEVPINGDAPFQIVLPIVSPGAKGQDTLAAVTLLGRAAVFETEAGAMSVLIALLPSPNQLPP